MKFRTLASIFGFVALDLIGQSGFAAPAVPVSNAEAGSESAKHTLLYVDRTESDQESSFKVESRWTGGDITQPSAWPSRVRLEWPSSSNASAPEAQIIFTMAKGMLVTQQRSPDDSGSARTDGSLLILTLKKAEGNFQIGVKLSTGDFEMLSLNVRISRPRTLLWTHESCRTHSVRLAETGAPGGGPAWVGLRCDKENKGQIPISLHFSASQSAWTPVASNPTSIQIPTGKLKLPLTLATLGVKHPSLGSRALAVNLHEAPSLPSRWGFGFELGPTFSIYSEPTANVSLSQLSLNSKAGIKFQISPRLGMDASAFITVLPLFNTSTAGAFRFWGANLRLSIALGRTGAWKWALSPGIYGWGMLVPSSSYGVAMLVGPQVFVAVERTLGSGRPLYFFLKVAPNMENPTAFRLGNQELALGGGIRLTQASSPHRLDLTWAAADSRFKSESGTSMSIDSFSLGIQYSPFSPSSN